MMRICAAASVAVAAVGLRILTRSDDPPINIVVKSSLSHFSTARTCEAEKDRCFLRACALCRKRFESDQDIYMYSGEGYCSVECREREIEIHEMKRLQASTERMTVSSGHCSRRSTHSTAMTEVRLLREELRRRRDLVTVPKTRMLLS